MIYNGKSAVMPLLPGAIQGAIISMALLCSSVVGTLSRSSIIGRISTSLVTIFCVEYRRKKC